MMKPIEINSKGNSKKYYTLLFGAIMGFIMSVLTSLVVTVINIGIVSNFFQMWLLLITLATFLLFVPMVCRNICLRLYAATQVSGSHYLGGGKYCRRCEYYFITQKTFCENSFETEEPEDIGKEGEEE